MPDRSGFFRGDGTRLSASELYLDATRESFRNPSWEKASSRVLIQRLSPYRDVKLSTPHLFLFRAVREALPGAYIDFSFFPGLRDRDILRSGGVPFMNGIASMREGADFDLILVSNAFTLELLNLPFLLKDSGFPLLSSERAKDEAKQGRSYPLIILGGSNALASQSIVAENLDSFVDGIFFGEGEDGVGPLVRILSERAREGRKVLERAARAVRGFWPAGSSNAVEKAVARNPMGRLEAEGYPFLDSEEASTARLKIAYGCPSFCTFCFEAWECKPYRELPLETLLETAKKLKASSGAETLEVFAYNFNTHSDIVPLLLGLNGIFRRVNAMSQRTDILADAPGLVPFEIAAGKRSFTLGIEGISARIRLLYGKELDREQIARAAAKLLREKIRELKLFYVLHGAESEADISEFVSFLKELKTLKEASNPSLRIVFSFGYLVRMPFTPLRHEKLILEAEHWRRIDYLVKMAVEGQGFDFRLAMDFEEYFTSQVLAMGGHELAGILAETAAEGIVYDQTLTEGARAFITSRMEASGLLGPGFLGEKGEEYPFAFPFLNSGIGKSFLFRRHLESRKKKTTASSCLGSECEGCGACEDEEEKLFLAGHATGSASEKEIARMAALIARKDLIEPIHVVLEIPESACGAGPEFLASWAMRSFAQHHPALFDSLLSARESLFTQKAWSSRIPSVWGKTVFGLVFLGDADYRASLAAEGFQVLEALPERLRPKALLKFPPEFDAEGRFGSLLEGKCIPCTIRKQEGRVSYEISERGRKKRDILSAVISTNVLESLISIEGGEKMDLSPLFDQRRGGIDHRKVSIRLSW